MPTLPERVHPMGARALWALTGAVVLIALAARWALVAEAGLDGLHAYDDGVYYAGAAALVAGRVPYADFLFLHPPGILVALAPFAALGAHTSDALGLAAARVAFWVLGAVNAALVTRLAAGYGLVPAAVAGLLYALWYPARYAERIPLLEPPGNTALLVALLLLTTGGASVPVRAQALAGGVLGLSACVKMWMAVPLFVVLVWQLAVTGGRAAARVAAGAAVAAGLLLAPFAPAGDRMFRMVVLDQLGRPVAETPLVERLLVIVGLSPLAERALLVGQVALLGVGVVTVLAVLAALRQPYGRLHVALLAATAAVLVASPSVFHHYGAYAAVPVMMVLAGAAAEVAERVRERRHSKAGTARSTGLAVVAVLGVSGLFLVNLAMLPVDTGRDFPAGRLRPSVTDRSCVVSDDPTVLAVLDVLSRDLRRDCRLLVDVTGHTYDRYAMEDAQGRAVPRPRNDRWQRAILDYLRSGCALVVVREETGLSAATRRQLAALPVLARAGSDVVRVRPSGCSSGVTARQASGAVLDRG